MSTDFSVSNYLSAHSRLAQQIDTAVLQHGIDVIRTAYESGRKIITADGLTDAAKKVVAAAKGAA